MALDPAPRLIGKPLFQTTLAVQRFFPLYGPYGARLYTGGVPTGVARRRRGRYIRERQSTAGQKRSTKGKPRSVHWTDIQTQR